MTILWLLSCVGCVTRIVAGSRKVAGFKIEDNSRLDRSISGSCVPVVKTTCPGRYGCFIDLMLEQWIRGRTPELLTVPSITYWGKYGAGYPARGGHLKAKPKRL